MATAQPSDVILEDGSAGVIATDLSDAEVQGFIDDAAFEASQAINGYDGWSSEEKTQLEKYVAALKIRLFADKAISSTSRETASVDYEGMTTEELRRNIDRRDPSGTLASQRDTNRYVGSTG